MQTKDAKPIKNSDSAKTAIAQMEEQIFQNIQEDPEDQSPKQQARVQYVNKRFKDMEEQRNQEYQWFGMVQSPTGGKNKYLTLTQYINESEKRLNGNIEKPDYKDDWQSNIFDNVTREKTISIIARLAAQRMKAKFYNDEGLNPTLPIIISNLYDKAGRGKLGQGRDDEFTVKSMWEAISKGTVVREESYRLGKRKIKETKGTFNKKGKLKMKTIYEWEDVWSEVVPLEEFYPGDMRQTNIQKMPDCARATEMSYSTFRQAFADFDEAKNVRPNRADRLQEKTTYQTNQDKEGKTVLVIKYYNRVTDSFDIVANSRLLTPLHNPLPYEHKQLPFSAARFEMLSNTFFYGMSLPFKLAAMQDMNNSIWNLSLDQLIIALKTPIFDATGSDIDIDWLYPGAVIPLKRGSDTNQVREFRKDLNAFSASQSAIQVIKSRLDGLSGAGSELAGIAGAGRGRTAEEVATAREAALDIIGLFLRFMEWAEEDRAEQRSQIMLEKYVKPLKQTGKRRSIVVDGVPLLNNQYGKMFVNITNKPRTQEELNKVNQETDEVSQVVDVKPEIIRRFKYLIKIVPDSSIKDTEFRRKQESLKFFGIASQAPQIFDMKNAALEVATAHGKDPNKALVRQNQPTPDEEVAQAIRGGGGMARGGGVRVPTDKEVANSQPDSFVQGQE